MSLFQVTLFAICSGVQAASDWIFDFTNKGYDFGEAIPPDGWKGVNRCGEPTNQSPINLMSPLGVYGWAYGQPIPHELEQLEQHYLNPKPGSSIVYERKNYKVFLNEIDPAYGDMESFINTEYLARFYKSKTTKFIPTSFHLHHPAEHPINGEHRDIALHLVHYVIDPHPEETQVALDIAIQFSVDDYDQDISQEEILTLGNFWDSLGWDGLQEEFEGIKQQILFKEFMDVVDLREKWVYSGSFAYPPCAKELGWYVFRKVYPIEFKHLYQIRKVFLEHRDELKATTNIRGIFPINGHQVYYVGALRQAVLSAGAAVAILSLLL